MAVTSLESLVHGRITALASSLVASGRMATVRVCGPGLSAIVSSLSGRIAAARQSGLALIVGAALATGPSVGRAISVTETV